MLRSQFSECNSELLVEMLLYLETVLFLSYTSQEAKKYTITLYNCCAAILAGRARRVPLELAHFVRTLSDYGIEFAPLYRKRTGPSGSLRSGAVA